jgi:AraC-like DNA-binding protein
MFPDVRGFQFLRSEGVWLESNGVQIDGVRIGVVSSSGHRITLNDELHQTLLLPMKGMIAVERGTTENTAHADQMLSVAIGERTTMVSENFLGIVIQLPFTMLDQHAALYDPECTRILFHGNDETDTARGVGGTLWRQARLLVDELDRSDVLLQSDKLGGSAINYLADLVVEHLAESANARSGSPTSPTASDRYVRRAEEFMRANLAEPITISDVAAHLGVSARSLQAGFRKHRNTSPREFLTARRLERARSLLLAPRPSDSVTTIIYDCGVGNTGRFAGLYRSVFGESPSATLVAARDRGRGFRRE